jgi:carboxypeptidase D
MLGKDLWTRIGVGLLLLSSSLTTAFRRLPSSPVVSSQAQLEAREQQQGGSHKRNLKSKPVHVVVPANPRDHLVTDLPLLAQGELPVEHWAGHLPASGGPGGDGDKYFFYWLFAPAGGTAAVAKDAPLLIWLNGGPACSSMDGLFLENGPLLWTLDTATGAYKLQANPSSWHTAPAYTLYIDQPVGTGLSFTTSGTYPRNDEQVNVDFYAFLQTFFALHADKFVDGHSVNRDVYFSGESHAGHYIPHMMRYILERNDAGAGEDGKSVSIPLGGAAIGNGWIDPRYQYAGAEAAYGHGIVGRAQVYAAEAKERACQEALTQGRYQASVCYDLLDSIVDNSYGSSSPYKISQYDVRRSELKHGDRNFPPGYKVTEAYLGGWALAGTDPGQLDIKITPQVLEALHASAATEAGQKYEECTDPPYEALAHQDGKGVVDDVVAVLQHASKPRLLFFNGIEDMICNHVGNEKLLEHLPWEHQNEWIEASRYAWISQQSPPTSPVAGYMKEFQNLLFLKIFAAGHMVPLDQPTVALDMIATFLYKGSFESSQQRIPAALEPTSADCPSCPTCPSVSPDNQMSDNPAEHPQTESPPQSGTMAWLGPFLAILGLGALVWSWRSRRFSKRLSSTVADKALELHSRPSSYHDDTPGEVI